MTELRHGYTLADLHSLARLAVHTAGKYASDWHERYDAAYSAIAEHLYSADHWPPRHDLVRVGQVAVHAEVAEHRRHHGYYKARTIGSSAGAGSSPAYVAYWTDLTAPAPGPERQVLERLALEQILPLLTAGQAEAVRALAAFGDWAAAAAALGLSSAAFRSQVSLGRRRFLAAWHEGERPSRVWGCDRRAGVRAGTTRRGGTAMDAIRRRRVG